MGLIKLVDLGEFGTNMKLPIPLGGIGIKRSLDKSIQMQVNALIKESLDMHLNITHNMEYVKNTHSDE
jgi:predicted solute-binding protein